MNILITGGAGFVGQRTAMECLRRGHLELDGNRSADISKIILTDNADPPFWHDGLREDARVSTSFGDISDEGFVKSLFADEIHVVFHLASIVSGHGEQDFDLAMRVNVDGARYLFEAIRAQENNCRVVFASSIAAFGGDQMPEMIDDNSKQTPRTTYGVTKVIGELLVNDYSRKGFFDGRSARLPTVIVRPGKPNLAASSFVSGLFREPLNGEPCVIPVDPSQLMPVLGYRSIVDGIIKLAEIPAEKLGTDRAVGLPAFNATVQELMDALKNAAGNRHLGEHVLEKDETIVAICNGWPKKADTTRAQQLGLPKETSLEEIVTQYIDDYLQEKGNMTTTESPISWQQKSNNDIGFVRLTEKDNVAVALRTLEAHESVDGIVTCSEIPKGHKLALSGIKKGQQVIKYAQIIGYAINDIPVGDHIHNHNIEFRATDHNYEYCVENTAPPLLDKDKQAVFQGYKRADGQVGTRNYIAVLASVNCSATAVQHIASAFTSEILSDYPNIDGVVGFSHSTGCGQADSGDGIENLKRVLWGYTQHSNIAGVLLVGLGCEVNQLSSLVSQYHMQRGPLLRTMNIQSVGGHQKTVAAGVARIKEMLQQANDVQRTSCPASELKLALQCGGSDAWSGITANPALGFAADLLVQNGGTAVLAETPEIYGAEHLLTRRAVDKDTGKKLVERILWWEDYVARNGGSMDNNPSPGNKLGGLTTILEKSLGAVAKGGTTRLNGVYRYAEKIDRNGFVFMDSPGYDPASITGEVAGGCNVVAFTTGRGSTYGCKPSPSIKIATNTEMYMRMQDDMDVNAGRIVSDGAGIRDVGQEIFDKLLAVASGEKSLSEQQGLGDHEFVPWQVGATM